MAHNIFKLFYKYLKCSIIIFIVAFILHIWIALSLFPSDNDNRFSLFKTQSKPEKLSSERGLLNKQDNSDKNQKHIKHEPILKVEELNFELPCDIKGNEVISAINRAKTQFCKKAIANLTCLIQSSKLYPSYLKSNCSSNAGKSYGNYLGCFEDDKKKRLLPGMYGTYAHTNSPNSCIDICIQSGFQFAGVQYGIECFCGNTMPSTLLKIEESSCRMSCPGDPDKFCGGYFTMNLYNTGLSKWQPVSARTPETRNNETVRIVFLLSLNGRALRQVHRLIHTLYRTHHYFYVHVDSRQDYMHRMLSLLEKRLSNFKMATNRYSTIWGGASLLQMLLSSMKEFHALNWKWDFVINLSESDFLIKPLEALEDFLGANKGHNFVRSQGHEVYRFIKKQGLDKTFLECEGRMWRLGSRQLPRGIVFDGGSDWVALSPEFVDYVTGEPDLLLTGLMTVFHHTLLPAESFFHVALRNSRFCNSYIDNNLHVTNWKRKLGCKCQYKHVVDWCGCSPNVFTPDDWPRLQNTQSRQVFFARKFEPVINQEIITRVEKSIGIHDHEKLTSLESYWQSIYHVEDLTASTDDMYLTHANSIVRLNSDVINEEFCDIKSGEILEISLYKDQDIYKGNLILYRAMLNDKIEVVLETWYKPRFYLAFNDVVDAEHIKIFKVSSDYDLKEKTFRNFGNILGPFSEPVLFYQMSFLSNKNFTIVWVDPTGTVADINEVNIKENESSDFVKPSLRHPLLPGIWRAVLTYQSRYIAKTKFLISPLEFYHGRDITLDYAEKVHRGSIHSYNNYTNIKLDIKVNQKDRVGLLNKINTNSLRLGEQLKDWIDNLNNMFFSILGSCVRVPNDGSQYVSCGRHMLKPCLTTNWSSLSPDPKGGIGKLDTKSSRLVRT